MMTPEVLVNAFLNTLNPETLKNGEVVLFEVNFYTITCLLKMQKELNFFSTVLKLIVEPSVDGGVRQAAAIYFKNKIISHWVKYPDDEDDTFIIPDGDKSIIRENIIPAIISLPAPLQIQMKSCLEKIIRADYPDNFPDLINKIKAHLNDANFHSLNGALLALYAFCQNYEYSKQSEWLIMDNVMREMLPGLFNLLTAFYQGKSEESQGLQKLILKCMNAYVAFRFPIETMHQEVLTQWINLLCSITSDFYQPKNDDPETLYWKTKKWASHFLVRISDKYGNPGQVTKKYKTFSENFLKSYSTQITNTCLQVCAHHHQGNFVSNRVLSTAMKYFTVALCHSFSYKLLKQHFNGLIEQVIHPLLSHNDEDEELWDDDPNEYIRYKFSIWDDFTISGTTDASFSLLEQACKKRKGILQYTMSFCYGILVSKTDDKRAVDGALTMIGAVSEILLKKKAYRNQLELFLVSHVFPAMESKERFIRSRACWLIQKLSSTRFQNQNIVEQIVDATRHLMSNDPEVPVRTMAAISLFDFVTDQTQVQDRLKPHLLQIVSELLKLLRLTEYDELSNVIEKVFYIYKDDIKPISKQMMEELATSFFLLMHYDPNTGKSIEETSGAEGPDIESRMSIAEGILENMENIAIIASEKDEILAELEPSVISVTRAILLNQCEELYENILKCLECMIFKNISPAMWQMYDFIYEAFKNGMRESFIDLMDILHQFIVADQKGFLELPGRIEKMLDMCHNILVDDEIDSDDHSRAAKLLEVIVLDYAGQIDSYIPKIVETALTRLSRKVPTKELEIMCLQVISAALFANSNIVLPLLCKHPWPNMTVPIVENFLKLLMDNSKFIEGLHDRRLFIMVVCKLLSLSPNERPAIINHHYQVFLPHLITLMQKLPDCYKAKKELDEDSDDEEDDENEFGDNEDAGGDDDEAGSDEDAVDEEDADYLDRLDKINEEVFNDGDDDCGEDESVVITDLEMYETVLEKDEHEKEEYGIFYRTMNQLEASQPDWYNSLLCSLSPEQKSTLKQLADLSIQEINQKEKNLKAGDSAHPAIVNVAFS